MANMVESQYMAKLMFREWIPQAYVITTTWAATARGSTCRRTRSRCVRAPIR